MTSKNPPDVIADRYVLGEHLGMGGFADVYVAEDQRLQREVAIKFLHLDRIKDDHNRERFLREARTIAQLSHPNIVQVYDLGQQDDWHFLVMEYIRGQSLHQYMQEEAEALVLDEAIPIMREILEGLNYAHQRGVVHRDIKPENILLTEDAQVKISDFGLALRQEDVRLTESGAFVGTLLYLPPEILVGEAADQRSDLYSAGATFYEMLTGKPIVTAQDSIHVMRDILNAPLTQPSLINPQIPEEIEEVVLRLLAKDPEQRFQDAREVLTTLPAPEQVQTLQEQALQQAIQSRMSQSRLERFIQSTSAEHRLADIDIEEDATYVPLIEKSTEEAQQSLLLYAAQEDTIEAIEAERRRIAGNLQNTLISQINLVLAQVQSYEHALGGSAQVRMALSVLSTLIRQLLQEAHDLEASLHPAVLETLGLEPALESLANQQRRVSGVTVSLALQRMRERLPSFIELALFRATQDAIDRAVRQAQARQILIQLEKDEEHLRYTISDDGLMSSGEILRSSRQRIAAIGGEMAISASKYGGIAISIGFRFEEPIMLTEREREVIELLVEGLTNKEIALLLQIRPRTVKFHLDNIYSKLGVNTRTEAAIYALRQGWAKHKDSPA